MNLFTLLQKNVMLTFLSYLRAFRAPTMPSIANSDPVQAAEPEYQRWFCANCGEHRQGAKAQGITSLAVISVLFGLTLLAMSMPIGGLFLLAAVLAPQRQPVMRCDYCKCGKFWTVSKKQSV